MKRVSMVFVVLLAWGCEKSGDCVVLCHDASVSDGGVVVPDASPADGGVESGVDAWVDAGDPDAAAADAGELDSGTPVPATRVVELSLGAEHACALLDNGEAWCWGGGTEGQLGDGSLGDSTSPVRVPLSGLRDIDAGRDFTCATDGAEVYCWGLDRMSRLGWRADSEIEALPVEVPFDPPVPPSWVSVAVGDENACATGDDRSVSCWGLFAGETSGSGTRRALGSADLDLGDQYGCHVLERNVSCWGIGPAARGGNRGWGWGALLAAGNDHACTLGGGRLLQCWGRNNRGQVTGLPTADEFTEPQTASSANEFIDIGAGSISCALRADMTGALCWGTSLDGRLSYHREILPGTENAIRVRIGDDFACILMSDEREIRCWGANERGQLGRAAPGFDGAPMPVVGLPL